MRSHLRTVFALLLAAVLLALFLRNTDLRQVGREMAEARLDLIVLAVVVTALTYLFRALRWQYLLAPVGRVRLSTALRTTIIGFAATALLPARAGEFLRPWLLARREGLSATAAFATVVVERLLDTVTVLLFFALFLLVFDPGAGAADRTTFAQIKLGGLVTAAVCAVALLVLFFLAGHPRLLDRLTAGLTRVLPARLAATAGRLLRLFAGGLAAVRQPGRLAVALLLSVPLWLSIAVGIWLVTQAFHIALPFTGSFLVLMLLVVGVAVPTPGAVGGFHYFYRLGVTAFYAAPNDRAVGAAIVLHAVSFVPVAIAGLLLLAQEGISLSRVERLARQEEAEGTP
ncbi:MAG TPA: lysylphosphatidylglycerol synthase transmembrane domain-containing protein [Methylomirabilota bacterium]